MPLQLEIWRVENKPEKLSQDSLDLEVRLEKWLSADLSLLGMELLLIGRQIKTEFGGVIDILALDREGNVCVIELKRSKAHREIVAQLLDYATWAKSLTRERIVDLFKFHNSGVEFEQALDDRFGSSRPEDLNESQKLFIVAADLDAATERIVTYLSESYGVPINTVFFRYFKDRNGEYLARTWLIDPSDAEAQSELRFASRNKEPWNGRDFYVAIGEGPHRSWEDCRKYGFVSGGQGRWYSRTLEQLKPGTRVFAFIPNVGYVGVGTVKEELRPVTKFVVLHDGKETSVLKVPLKAERMDENSGDAELSEYLVKVEWLKTVPVEKAYWEKGLFANQNTVCKLRSRFTLEKLSEFFKLDRGDVGI